MKTDELSKLWMELVQLKKREAEIEGLLAPEIKNRGEQSFGGMTAKISKPKTNYDYETAIKDFLNSISNNAEKRMGAKRITRSFWKLNYSAKLADALGIKKDDIPFSMSGDVKVSFVLEKEEEEF